MILRLVSIQSKGAGVYSFWFRPDEATSWQSGQSIRLELPQGERRFSISSAPFEKDICITTRVSNSRFKQALVAMQPGDTINGFNIEGTFTWPNTQRPVIFCAQGIGVTPYRAMLQQQAHEGGALDVTLLYTARGEDFVFAAELEQLQADHPELHVICLPRQELSSDLIAAYADHNLTKSLVYLSGSSAVVTDVASGLVKAGVPKPSIKQDWFTGKAGWDVL